MTPSIEYLEENTLIKISGSFDAEMTRTTQAFFDELVKYIDTNIIIDLSLVTQIDSSGIGALLFLFKRLYMAGYTLELIGLHGQPLKKLQILGLNKTIKMSKLSR